MGLKHCQAMSLLVSSPLLLRTDDNTSKPVCGFRQSADTIPAHQVPGFAALQQDKEH